jgi:hypothetical protein
MAKKFKARLVGSRGNLNAAIFIGGVWRIFATPYSLGREEVKPFKHVANAKRAANSMAKELDIKLDWRG